MINMVCSIGGIRPFSCASFDVINWAKKITGRLLVWDVKTRETYVEFYCDRIRSVEFLSFGCTDSIIICAGNFGAFGECGVVVWEVVICSVTNCLQVVTKSQFNVSQQMLRTLCFNPLMDALFSYDDEICSCFVVTSVRTGAEIMRIKAPQTTRCMKFMHEETVVLM